MGGRLYWIKVFLLLAAIITLTWYHRQGVNNPFADSLTVTVEGDAEGYVVTCATTRRGGTRVAAGELRVREHEERLRTAVGDRVTFGDVYPFADSVRATLLTYANMDILTCGNDIFAQRPAGVRSRFWEKLELLIIPPANGEDIMRVREYFRPRHMIVTGLCDMTPPPNLRCAENGAFKYDFEIKGGMLRHVE